MFDDGQAIRNAGHAQVVEIDVGSERIRLNPRELRIQTSVFFLCAVKADTPEKTEWLKSQMKLFEEPYIKKRCVYYYDYRGKIQQKPSDDTKAEVRGGVTFAACFDNNRLDGFQNHCGKCIRLADLNLNIELSEERHGKKCKTYQSVLLSIFKSK